MRKLSNVLRRAHVAIAARPRDDSGIADYTVVIVGLVAAGFIIVGVVTGFINDQLSSLGG